MYKFTILVLILSSKYAFLNIRTLENGHVELGVHIADVTHFVKPGMLTDMEARSRSTTVYLADRRFDMLPGILSADLCSLISAVDRCVYHRIVYILCVSVILCAILFCSSLE